MITPEQRLQWNLYSCVPRCIIKLAERSGNPISEDDFAAQFEKTIPEWTNRFGLTNIHEALQIINTLKLASDVRHFKDTVSWLQFDRLIVEAYHALVLTHKSPSPADRATF